jgi:hypothetical protein
MRMRSLGLLVAAVVAVPGAAQETGQMSPEEKAMMEAMEKAAALGKQHQWLAGKAGAWTWTGKFWMDPSAPPTEMTGTAERAVMLGGRVLSEKVASPGMMGQPFEGFGLTGYDNVTKAFWGTWSDNMGTGVMMSKGQCDDKGTCAFTGEYADPVTGKMKKTRMTSRDDGPDKELHEFFDTDEAGKEYKSMELVYTRKK